MRKKKKAFCNIYDMAKCTSNQIILRKRKDSTLRYLMLKRNTKGLIKKYAYVFKGHCV